MCSNLPPPNAFLCRFPGLIINNNNNNNFNDQYRDLSQRRWQNTDFPSQNHNQPLIPSSGVPTCRYHGPDQTRRCTTSISATHGILTCANESFVHPHHTYARDHDDNESLESLLRDLLSHAIRECNCDSGLNVMANGPSCQTICHHSTATQPQPQSRLQQCAVSAADQQELTSRLIDLIECLATVPQTLTENHNHNHNHGRTSRMRTTHCLNPRSDRLTSCTCDTAAATINCNTCATTKPQIKALLDILLRIVRRQSSVGMHHQNHTLTQHRYRNRHGDRSTCFQGRSHPCLHRAPPLTNTRPFDTHVAYLLNRILDHLELRVPCHAPSEPQSHICVHRYVQSLRQALQDIQGQVGSGDGHDIAMCGCGCRSGNGGVGECVEVSRTMTRRTYREVEGRRTRPRVGGLHLGWTL